jgi:hypothetical protein
MIDIESCTWEILMIIPNMERLKRIVEFLDKKSYWAFVYTESNQHPFYYTLYGYIMLRFSHKRDWFVANLGGDDTYSITNEHPNKYRKTAIDIIDKFGLQRYAIERIDRGWYPAGVQPYLPIH